MTAKASPQARIEDIGFFHCGYEGKRNAFEALTAVLRKAKVEHMRLSRSLIVLPEAFNLDEYYGTFSPDTSVRASLVQLSQIWDIAFVVGLIEEDTSYNCACLIDTDLCDVLSYKTDLDPFVRYRPYSKSRDVNRLHRGLRVGALVCNDATENSSDCSLEEKRARLEAVAKALSDAGDGAEAVLCVPAYMGTVSSAAVVDEWTRRRPELVVILANGRATQPSVIMRRGESAVVSEKEGASVCLIRLDGQKRSAGPTCLRIV